MSAVVNCTMITERPTSTQIREWIFRAGYYSPYGQNDIVLLKSIFTFAAQLVFSKASVLLQINFFANIPIKFLISNFFIFSLQKISSIR